MERVRVGAVKVDGFTVEYEAGESLQSVYSEGMKESSKSPISCH